MLLRPTRRIALVLFLLAASGASANGDRIVWAPSLELALEQAQVEKKIVMVDFFTRSCSWCKALDAQTFADPRVVAASRDFVNLRVDAAARPDLAREYAVTAYPTVVFLRPDGRVRTSLRGFKPPESFLPQMENARSFGGQLLALQNLIVDRPGDAGLVRQRAEMLALSARWLDAARALEDLLARGEGSREARAADELDVLLYRLRAGEDQRAKLLTWTEKNTGHPRALEALLHFGRASATAGDEKAASTAFRTIQAARPGSWVAMAAGGAEEQARNEKARSQGP